MAITESPPRRKDAIATRARLVRAALDLFTSIGYDRTTTLEIAARAGIAEATIYRHFTGKDALFNEAIREANRWGLAAIRHDERDRTVAVRDRLTRMARRILEQAARDPTLPVLLLQKIKPELLEDATGSLRREFRDTLGHVFATAKQEGKVRPGSAELWSAVWLAVVQFALERVVAREWTPDHSNVTLALDAAWDAIAYRPVESPVSRPE